MPSLLTLVIAYVGIGGPGASKVDKQVRALVAEETEVADAELTKAERKELITRGPDASDIVQRLDATGVIAGELKKNKRGTTLTIVVYGHDGALVNLIDLPVGTKKKKVKKLNADDLDSVREAVISDVRSLVRAEQEEIERRREREREIAAAEERRAAEEAATAEAAEAEALAARKRASRRAHGPLVRVHAGLGPRSRVFSPEPDELRGYESSPVPAARIVAEIDPMKYVGIDLEGERTLTMHSDLDGMSASSSILRWQATGAFEYPLGKLELAAVAGLGGREFTIDADARPTPNGHYVYATLGGRLGLRLTPRIELRAGAAFQPVIGGAEDDTMSELGPSSRTAVEVGGGVIVSATDHVYVAGEASYQRFTWTWDAGSATDEYPSGTLSIGASY